MALLNYAEAGRTEPVGSRIVQPGKAPSARLHAHHSSSLALRTDLIGIRFAGVELVLLKVLLKLDVV